MKVQDFNQQLKSRKGSFTLDVVHYRHTTDAIHISVVIKVFLSLKKQIDPVR